MAKGPFTVAEVNGEVLNRPLRSRNGGKADILRDRTNIVVKAPEKPQSVGKKRKRQIDCVKRELPNRKGRGIAPIRLHDDYWQEDEDDFEEAKDTVKGKQGRPRKIHKEEAVIVKKEEAAELAPEDENKVKKEEAAEDILVNKKEPVVEDKVKKEEDVLEDKESGLVPALRVSPRIKEIKSRLQTVKVKFVEDDSTSEMIDVVRKERLQIEGAFKPDAHIMPIIDLNDEMKAALRDDKAKIEQIYNAAINELTQGIEGEMPELPEGLSYTETLVGVDEENDNKMVELRKNLKSEAPDCECKKNGAGKLVL
jgi:hypothetical protein